MTDFVNQDGATPPVAGTPSDMDSWDLSDYATSTILQHTGTRYKIQIGTIVWTFEGSGFTYDGGNRINGGTIDGLTVEQGGTVYADIDDFSMTANAFKAFMTANDTQGFQHALFTGADAIDGAYHAIGYEGNDTISNAVIVEAGSGDDTITVKGVAATSVDAGINNDHIIIDGGQLMEGQILGGAGNDTISGNWVVDGGFRGDTASIELISDANIKGTHARDRIDLSSMDHTDATNVKIDGRSGNDSLFGTDTGAVDIIGGSGNDRLHARGSTGDMDGGSGNDRIAGGPLVNIITDTVGIDKIRGFEGDDVITIGDGGDNADGNEGNDTIINLSGLDSRMHGGAGNDIITGQGDSSDHMLGGLQDDILNMGGGDDDAHGNEGDDTFRVTLNSMLDAGDTVDGGDGLDVLELNATGTPFTLTAILKSIETLSTQGGDITIDDDALDSETLTVDATGAALDFDGSGEDDGQFIVNGTSFNDTLLGGSRNDDFNAGTGNDTIRGGNGKDDINFTNDTGSTLTAADIADGGGGLDTLTLSGFYDGANALNLDANTIINIETLVLLAGNVGSNNFAYDISFDDGNIGAGKILTVDATDLRNNGPAIIDGRDESDGSFEFLSGDAGDTFIGGAGDDSFDGGAAADLLTGDDGADVFKYHDVSDSTGSVFDTISTFDATEDALGFTFAVTGVDVAVEGGALSRDSFNADMASAIGSGQLAGHHAVIFNPDAGFFAGRSFLVVDANGNSGFQADADFVIELSGANVSGLAGAFVVI